MQRKIQGDDSVSIKILNLVLRSVTDPDGLILGRRVPTYRLLGTSMPVMPLSSRIVWIWWDWE